MVKKSENPITISEVGVLLLGFSRPKLLKKRISEIHDSKVENLYISIDGGIESHTKEMESVKQFAQQTFTGVKLNISHQSTNLGMVPHITSQITRVLSSHRYIIIVEDDIKLSTSLISNLLNGINLLNESDRLGIVSGGSILFSNQFTNKWRETCTPFMQGVAFSSDVWKGISFDLSSVNVEKALEKSTNWQNFNKYQKVLWLKKFKMVQLNPLYTWDHQFVFHTLTNNFSTIAPIFSMIGNEGWGPEATHTKGPKPKMTKNHKLNSQEISSHTRLSKFYALLDMDNLYNRYRTGLARRFRTLKRVF